MLARRVDLEDAPWLRSHTSIQSPTYLELCKDTCNMAETRSMRKKRKVGRRSSCSMFRALPFELMRDPSLRPPGGR